MSAKQPVVFIFFCRPELTVQSFASIAAYRPATLYLVSDGARNQKEGEIVGALRGRIEELISWDCNVRKIYADANMGCARRISSALDIVFATEPSAIILEDDCVADDSFFAFCQACLHHFRDDLSIGAISGTNVLGACECDSDIYLSHMMHCWGWATWADRWQYFDYTLSAWNNKSRARLLRKYTGSSLLAGFWLRQIDRIRKKEIDTWAFRWFFTQVLHNMSTIVPRQNLVSNTGFGENSTHTKEATHPCANIERQSLPITDLRYSANNYPYDKAIFLKLYGLSGRLRIRYILRYFRELIREA